MVYINFGGRGRRRYGRPAGYGGYGGYPRGYGGGGGGGCLRDLLLVETGCCLAEALGCGPQLVLLAPRAGAVLLAPALHRPPANRSRAVALVRLYQERISARRRRPCCRMTPSCSAYAIEALQTHGTARGLRLTAARLLRCRPGGPTGPDPVPPARVRSATAQTRRPG
jgi:putative membrane protein insertion efficiency factor